ncbi:hypothetical protein BDSB_05405 [Burkholderia dolosa PC543]|nr:hypothetical protein BDSB_05405 [Burkholderia dolosa PC543]
MIGLLFLLEACDASRVAVHLFGCFAQILSNQLRRVHQPEMCRQTERLGT